MLALPEFLTNSRNGRRRHADLWSVAERLVEIGAGDVTGYDATNKAVLFSSRDPIRLERRGGKPLTDDQVQELQDNVAALIY